MADDSQLKKQIKVGTHINNHFVNFKKLGQESMTIELANVRMHRLDDLWQQFQDNDLSLQQLTPEDKIAIDPNKAYFTEDVLYDMMESYDRNRASYEAFIRVNSPDQTVDQAIVAHNSTMISNDTQDVSALLKSLPQISIKKFAGKSSDWPPFRDLFKSLVHAQKISSVIKLSLLRSYLVGEALDVIKNIPISETNYDVAWNALALHYENERRLVNQQLSDLFAVKPMTHESHSEVKRIFSEMSGPLESLKALGRPTDQWSDVLVFMMAKNLHKNVRRDWEKNLGTSVKTPNLDRMQTFLKTQSTMLEAVERSTKLVSSATQPQTPTKKPASGTSLATSVKNLTKESPKTSEPKSCAFCKNDHYLNRCPQLLEKSIEDRRAFVTQKRLCFNCLGPHQMKDCKSKFRCYTCKAKHHTILHSQKIPPPSDSSIDQSTCQVSAIPTAYSHFTSYHERTGVLLGTARIFVEGPDGRKIKVRALIDNCSQPSFISENIFKKFELPSTSTNAPILAVGGVPAVTGREVTSFKIRPHFSSRFSCEVKALVVPRVCSYTPPQTQIVSSLVYLSHINLADPTFLDTDEIDVLLGADVQARIIQESIVRGRPEEPIATSSLLGWVISGSVPLSAQVATLTSLHCSGVDDNSETLRNFWRVEELPAIKYLTPAEEQCEKHYSDTVKRDEDGRYVVKLPFKSSESLRLGDSYRQAVIILKRMEEKFEVDPELKKLYFDFMEEYISSGHMIPITEDSPLYKPRDECFFLPHHGVLKPSSSTTKLRTVFNGSSKSNLNLSLNSQLHTGPNLLPELPDLICAWRTYRYVFVADIKQMFRQIRVNESDLHHQAIVWRFNPNDPIQTYFLTTVTYGLVSSPYQANRTLRQLASDYKSTYPLASDVLSKECYMDDMLSGDHSMGLVLEKQNQLINMLKKGGFELRKWLSNDPEILSHLPSDHLASEQAAIFEAASSFSVLGLQWQAKDDLFTFSVNIAPSSGVNTKRTILSTIAQIFDPMGWLAPVIISAKIFMQSLWLLKCDWDDPLPSEYVEQWKSWAAKLDSINSITIPRFVHYSPNATTCEIHGFADASQRAYSAVVYLRIISDGEVNCLLQLAKTRVAPLKTLSIPRLELLGAHVLAKLTQHFISVIPLGINSIHLWSDSKDVLFWLRSHPSRWQTFVANRCSDIHTVVPNAYWHYVKSADNPADVASRGIDPELLADHPLWWHSPSWLKNISDPWPTNPDDLLEHASIEERPSKIDLVANAATQEPSPEEKMWDSAKSCR